MQQTDKTLIILTPGFPANEADSTCLPFPQLLVRTLKQLHPSLHIIVLALQYPFAKSVYNWHGVEVIAFNGQNKGKIKRLLVWVAALKKIGEIVKENKVIGILNCWLGECGLLGKYAARKYGIPSFTWILGQDARKGNRYFPLIKPKAASLVALSDAIATELYKNYQILPAHIIPPGIDTKAFPDFTNTRDIDILGVGSLIPLKQYDIFIEVVARLALQRPAIKAVICGNGTEREHLQKTITAAGLTANITLTGELPHAAVLELMQRAKIFLHPSSYEGFATVYMEALYAGAHVAGFCQPMQDTCKHLHIVKDTAGMIDEAGKLLADPNLDQDRVLTRPIQVTCYELLALFGM